MVIRQYNNFSVKRSRSKRQTNRQKGNSVPSCVMKPLPLALPSRENPTCLMSAASVGVCHHSHITSITTITTSQLHSSSECRVLFSLLIFICISRCCCCQFAYWWAHLVCPVRKEFIFSFSLSRGILSLIRSSSPIFAGAMMVHTSYRWWSGCCTSTRPVMKPSKKATEKKEEEEKKSSKNKVNQKETLVKHTHTHTELHLVQSKCNRSEHQEEGKAGTIQSQ